MNIKLINQPDITKANAITHSGPFHADDILSTVLLSKFLPEVKLCRTSKVSTEDCSKDVIVYDIGGGPFDHHQIGFTEARENGIRYSSFGLLWKRFGMQLLSNYNVENAEDVFKLFDQNLVCSIDAIDNGQVTRHPGDVQVMTVSSVISSFNPNWDETGKEIEDCFLNACKFAEVIFDNSIKNVISTVKAKAGVESAIKKSANGIMILPEYLPWQNHIFNTLNKTAADRILYVVFPSNRGGYNVQAVPDAPGSFGQRKPLPESWAGLSGDAFAKASGVETSTFCHQGRFICGARTFADAFVLAQKAVKA